MVQLPQPYPPKKCDFICWNREAHDRSHLLCSQMALWTTYTNIGKAIATIAQIAV